MSDAHEATGSEDWGRSRWEWRTRAGRDWQVLLGDLEPDSVLLGITFDYGLIDESPRDLGALSLLAGHLTAELQRPVEVGGGEVSVPDVAVEIATSTTTLTITGRRRAVLGAWEHLGELFRRPRLTIDAPPAPVPSCVWHKDLAAHTGANAASLASLRIIGTRDVRRAEALLAGLAPSANRVRYALHTNDPYLVGEGWAGEPDAGRAPRRPARYLDRRPALLDSVDEAVLFSVLLPATRLGLAASQAIGVRTARLLDEVGVGDGVGLSRYDVRDAVLTVLKVEGGMSDAQRRRLLDLLLQPGVPLADSVVERAIDAIEHADLSAIDRVQHLRGWDLDGNPLDREHWDSSSLAGPGADPCPGPDLDAELRALASGGLGAAPASGTWPAGPAAPAPGRTPLTSAGVRAAVDAALGTIHSVRTRENRSLASGGRFLVWDPPSLPTDRQELLRGHFDPGARPDSTRPQYLATDGRALFGVWCEWGRDASGAFEPHGIIGERWIDLGELAVGVNHADSGLISLVDERGRTLTVPWAALTERPRMMALLEQYGLPTVPWYHLGD